MASLKEEQTPDEGSDEQSHWKEAVGAILHLRNLKIVAVLVSAALYFLAAVLIYMPAEDWGVGDCLYYAVVVVTTVGYGDFLPTTNHMKIVTIIFVHLGLSIVVLALGIVQDFITHVSISRAVGRKMKADESGLFQTGKQKRDQRIKVAKVVSLYILYVIMGTIFFGWEIKSQDIDVASEAPFLDGLYLTVITLSTVGFGDLSPVSDVGKAVGAIIMLTGIPVFGTCFSMVNDMLYSAPESPVVLHKIKANEFDLNKLTAIEDFVEDMRTKYGVGDYAEQGEGNISRLEFLAFILVQNGCCEVDNVTNVMKNFDALDKTGSGFISKDDVSALSNSAPHSFRLSANLRNVPVDQKQPATSEMEV